MLNSSYTEEQMGRSSFSKKIFLIKLRCDRHISGTGIAFCKYILDTHRR